MQQQLREAGIVLDIRGFKFATFFSDVQHGAFQMYSLRWIGGNEDPDIFEYAFHSAKFPPNGANRGYYSNPKIDALIDKARREIDPNVRKRATTTSCALRNWNRETETETETIPSYIFPLRASAMSA